jgi:hypothetical protein
VQGINGCCCSNIIARVASNAAGCIIIGCNGHDIPLPHRFVKEVRQCLRIRVKPVRVEATGVFNRSRHGMKDCHR